MLAVGIPSYNEADNIAKLAVAVDKAATGLGIEAVLINADNSSPDRTAKRFVEARTHCEKVSLITTEVGKGYNVKAIIDYVAANDNITYCLFIDGDVTSFNPEWLVKHKESSDDGYDYVIPNYSRNMQEGNTTNHFVYPLLFSLTDGNAPYQGIAGDFGVSHHYAKYLSRQLWPKSSLGYGVDIFMTITALTTGMRVREIALDRKIHKPSFDKMVGMFQQVAESYFETRNNVSITTEINFDKQKDSKLLLLAGTPIAANKLEDRLRTAVSLYEANEANNLSICSMPAIRQMNLQEWVDVVSKHDRRRQQYTPTELALSLTPFYLLRVLTYLNTIQNPVDAVRQINQTAVLLRGNLGNIS